MPAIGAVSLTGMPRVRATLAWTLLGTEAFALPFGLTEIVVTALVAPPWAVVAVTVSSYWPKAAVAGTWTIALRLAGVARLVPASLGGRVKVELERRRLGARQGRGGRQFELRQFGGGAGEVEDERDLELRTGDRADRCRVGDLQVGDAQGRFTRRFGAPAGGPFFRFSLLCS